MSRLATLTSSLAALGLATAASAISSTVLKEELIPEQMKWLSAAGTVVAACFIPIAFTNREFLSRKAVRRVLTFSLIISVSVVIALRASRTIELEINNKTASYLLGFHTSLSGRALLAKCTGPTQEDRIRCAGTDLIPRIYGWTYDLAYGIFLSVYLMSLATFVCLVSAIQLEDTPERLSN